MINNKKLVLLQLQENHLKRIIICMVITFVFTMKARFVKVDQKSILYLYADFVIE